MFKSKKAIQHLIIILICFGFVGSYYYFIKAAATPVVQFTADTDVNLTDLSVGDLQIASNSEAVGLTILGANLIIDDITDGSSFIFKTPEHTNALSLTPSGQALDLSLSSSNISSDDITSWTLTAAGAVDIAHVVGVPQTSTSYDVKVNGSTYGAYTSSGSGELAFTYSGTPSASVFTYEESAEDTTTTTGGGSVLIIQIPPSLPEPTVENPEGEFKVIVAPEDDEFVTDETGKVISAKETTETTITLKLFAGENIDRMVISEDPEFKDAGQEPFKEIKKWTLSPGEGKKTIYVKFFTKYGIESEVVSINVILVPKVSVVEITPSVPATTTSTTLPKIIKIVTPKSIQKIIAGKYETYSGWSASIYAELAESVAIGTKKLYVAIKLFTINVFDWTINGIYNLMPNDLIDWLFEPDSSNWFKETKESIKTPKEIIIKDSEDYYNGIAGTIYGDLAEKIVQKNNKIIKWIKDGLIRLIKE